MKKSTSQNSIKTTKTTESSKATEYVRHELNIQGSKVTVSFPDKCADKNVMDIVKQILIYAHTNNELENSEVGD